MIIEKKFIFYLLSLILVAFGLFAFIYLKPDFGIDLVGGEVLEVKTKANLREIISNLDIKAQLYETDEFTLIKAKKGLDDLWQKIKAEDNQAERLRFEEISPSLSSELRKKGFTAVLLVILAIALYVTYAFRKVKTVIKASFLGLVVILTLLHDVIASVGPYVLLSKVFGFSIDLKFITALLVVAGYSVSDTIVVFDRIRENILKTGKKDKETFQKSIQEVYLRSIYTSLTTVLAILPLALMIKTLTPFLFALQIGIIIGTYSSIFLATPILYDLTKK